MSSKPKPLRHLKLEGCELAADIAGLPKPKPYTPQKINPKFDPKLWTLNPTPQLPRYLKLVAFEFEARIAGVSEH